MFSLQRHIDNVIDGTRKRLTMNKIIAVVKWGCGRETLNKTYNLCVKPLFCHFSKFLMGFRNTYISKLEVFKNETMRLITGAA